jgi:glycosyltransferase involved in cell wall biosynthesis
MPLMNRDGYAGGEGKRCKMSRMNAKRRALLLVPAWPGQPSVTEIADESARLQRPRVDYVELARVLDGDVVDMTYLRTRASRPARRLNRWLGSVPAQVVEAFLLRRRYTYIVARADRLGLPLALLLKLVHSPARVVLISVWLSRWKKAVFLSRLSVHTHLSAIINYSSVQADIAVTRLGVPPDKVFVRLHHVDERFWRPDPTVAVERMICSVGAEHRDYPTLLEAVRDLDVDVELAIGTADWAGAVGRNAFLTRALGRAREARPQSKVRLHEQLDSVQLRSMYARASFVVVPLEDVDFDAGVTVICEAMAMGKAVVVTRSRGQREVVRDGETGIYVPPGDDRALRSAIIRLLDDPEMARRMGAAGRRLAEESHTLDQWVSDVAEMVKNTSGVDRSKP